MNQNQRQIGLILGIAGVLLVIQWLVIDRRWNRRLTEIREDLRYLQADLAALQGREWSIQKGNTVSAEVANNDDIRLQKAFQRLDGRNLIERYQAGMTIREFGARAVPELLARLRHGSSQSRQAALLLLGDMKEPDALPELRKLAMTGLNQNGGSEQANQKEVPDHKTLAAILGILTQMKDRESLPLFKTAFQNHDDRVRTAALLGLREMEAIDFLPELAARLGQEQELINRELEKTILGFCHRNPDNFVVQLERVPPQLRFTIIKMLGNDPATTSLTALHTLTRDGDARIALSAAGVLAKRGDAGGRETAQRLSQAKDREISQIAADILKTLEAAGKITQ